MAPCTGFPLNFRTPLLLGASRHDTVHHARTRGIFLRSPSSSRTFQKGSPRQPSSAPRGRWQPLAAQSCFPSCRLQAPNGTVAITLPLHGGNRRAGLRACRRRSAPRPSKRALMRWSRSRQQQWHRCSSWRRRSGGRRRRGRSRINVREQRKQSVEDAAAITEEGTYLSLSQVEAGDLVVATRKRAMPEAPDDEADHLPSPARTATVRRSCSLLALPSLTQHRATSTLPFTPTHPHTIRVSLPTTTTTPPLPAGAPPRPLRPPPH